MSDENKDAADLRNVLASAATELELAARGQSLQGPRERADASRRLSRANERYQRAWAAWNEAQHPTGPELSVWTTDRLREGLSDAIKSQYDAFWADIERLRLGSSLIELESLLRFLEADPWWDGSGYDKSRILRYLRRQELAAYEARLRNVIKRVAMDPRPRRELRDYALLTAHLMNEELASFLRHQAASGNRTARRLIVMARSAGATAGEVK